MAEKVNDPVCGMEIDPRTAAAKMDYQGTTYFFSSDACHNKFVAEPEIVFSEQSGTQPTDSNDG